MAEAPVARLHAAEVKVDAMETLAGRHGVVPQEPVALNNGVACSIHAGGNKVPQNRGGGNDDRVIRASGASMNGELKSRAP